MTSRADSLNRPRIGNIQNGCTRFATASPRLYVTTTQPRCTLSECAAAMTYGASMTHFDPPDGTNTPSTPEYTATRAGNVVAVEMLTNRSARRSFRCVAVMMPAMPASNETGE